MWREFFHFINYTFNPHAVPLFLTAVLLTALGSVVLVREKASQVSLKFFFLTSTLSIWLFCFSMMYCAELPEVALSWSKLAYIGVPFLPVSIYLFALSILQLSSHYKIRFWSIMLMATGFSGAALFTNQFITHVQLFNWGYYPQYGLLSLPFLAFFFTLMVLSIKHYWNAYKITPTHSRHHHRVTLFLIAFLIALLGAVDYLVKFGIPIYPVGFLPISIFALLAAFTVRRFHLQDIPSTYSINEVMDHLGDALLVLDRDGAIRVVNETACTLFEIKEKDLIGKSIHCIAPQIISQNQWNNLIDHDTPVKQAEIDITTDKGKEIYASISANSMKDKKNEFLGIICLVRDLSEIKKEQEARKKIEERMNLLFNSKIIGITIANFNGNIIEGNDAFLQMLGLTEKDMPCKWTKLTPEEWQPKDEFAVQELKMKGTATPYEKEYFYKDGSRVPILIGAALLPESQNECACFILDITEQKKAEQKIQHLNFDLEKRVEQRTEELKDLVQELEAFSYSISHELRTPLTLIGGFSKLLSETHHDKLDKEGKSYLNHIQDHTQQMGDLIEDLMVYSQLSRKEILTNDFNIESMCKEVFEDFKLLEPDRVCLLKIASPLPHVLGDEVMIRQVISNLMGNAIKFTKNQELSIIEIGAIEKKGKLTFYIQDNGVGFNMKEINKLFTVFQRLHDKQNFKGTGAGLAIVQRIIVRHGGKIWAESKMGKGTIFYFTLPLASAKEEAA